MTKSDIRSRIGNTAGILFALFMALTAALTLRVSSVQAAGIVVNDAGDSTTAGDSQCTLREAINNANADSDTTGGDCTAGSGADTITFNIPSGGACSSANTCTISTGSTLPAITSDVTIDGTPNNGRITLDGGGSHGIMEVSSGGTLTANALTFANGSNFLGGGAISVSAGGTLNVTNSTFSGNDGGSVGPGGAINNRGTANVANSTFNNNTTSVTFNGGAIWNSATLNVTNSTFSGNGAGGAGGAGGAIFNFTTGTATLNNNIVADSTGGGDCVNWGSASGNNNLIEDSSNACGFTDGTNGNIVGTDPALAALADNGGPTQTMAPGAGSAAIGAGDDAVCVAAPVNNLDQRGVTRPQGARCDIGAYERAPLRFTIEAPGVQTSQVQTCTDLRTETFDGYDVDSYSTVFSAKLGIYARLGGAADFDIKAQDEFGGAETPTPTPPDTEKFIGTTQSEYTLTFNPITFPDGVGYFGFWWSAGDGENVLEITRNDGTVETFTTQSILNSPALQGSPNPGSGVVDGHFGNPTAAYLGVNAGEAYAFVNIFARDDASRIKSIRFIETGPSSFESDNHTVCADLIDGNNQGGTELGAIIIKKVTIPANSLLFNFTDDIESPNAFSLSNGGVKTFLKVAPGAYTVTEAAGNGAYEARDVTCVDGDPNGKPSSGSVDTITRTGTATINVDANETVTCTFTNSNQPLAITLGWFLAEANGDSVDFRWQTATETGTAGFNLMAATEEGKVQLNGELIPSPVVDSLTPTNYAVSLATDATLFYLQEASVDGSVTEHGPFALGEAYGEYSVPGGVELSPRIWLPLMVR